VKWSSPIAAAAIVASGALFGACGGDGGGASDAAPRGRSLYEQNCAACHGTDLRGTEAGPPFLHELYSPTRLPDEVFQSAVLDGIEQKNWEFGAMAPVAGLDRADVQAIMEYVRSVQREEGFD
jgi:mono/diheme cytochrome c family protein